MDNSLDQLRTELTLWQRVGKRPHFFLRDDDAIDVTPELEQLTELIEKWNIPLLLAVIPKFATPALGEFVKKHPLITPAVHGWAHENHARAGNKKSEFDDDRPESQIRDELEMGRARLTQLFGTRLSPLFVPPWNRIGNKAIQATLEVGFAGISGFGWKERYGSQKWVNTHVDVIDWKAGKIGKNLEQAAEEIIDCLDVAIAKKNQSIGLLTHHLIHDGNVWSMLDDLISRLEPNLR